MAMTHNPNVPPEALAIGRLVSTRNEVECLHPAELGAAVTVYTNNGWEVEHITEDTRHERGGVLSWRAYFIKRFNQ